jgi:REP element-mobilizing transposase RayT
MARLLRMEYEGGVYHVFNRGNYRSNIFRADKTKVAFLKCLGEACEKTGWKVHAWCVMTNHYHLALETPQPNLVEGMRWLQGTFANRFNRMRKEHGHLFQGRYKSLIVDPAGGLGSLCHYIHLNPVRTVLCEADDLKNWRWSSVAWMSRRQDRPEWFDPTASLSAAGGLKDTPAGHRGYLKYLAWLAEDEPARKEQRFDQMSKGSAIGTTEFQKELARENREFAATRKTISNDLEEAKEAALQETLACLLKSIGRKPSEATADGKFAEWKVAVAAAMKERTTVTNRWLSDNLAMGSIPEVSRRVTAWNRNPDKALTRKLGNSTKYTI